MPYEEIEVRITREGFIFVDTRGMEPERVRSVVEYLREVIGPEREIVTDPDDFPRQTINLDDERRQSLQDHLDVDDERQAEEESRRLRLER